MDPKLQELRMILSFVQPFIGASILLCFYLWLRGRQVKDRSLVWLSLTLYSSALPAAIQLVTWKGNYVWIIAAVCSPASSILITITAFQLLRVREAIRLHNLLTWTKIIVWIVTVGSVAALLLILSAGGKTGTLLSVGLNIDAVASLIALSTMALCLSYSFYKYDNQPLIILTLVDFIYFAWYQFYIAARAGGLVENRFLMALNITSVSIMTMLFIALTLAWGLSHASRLSFRDSEAVEVIVMFLDLRGSTQWAKKVSDGKYVVNFMNKFTKWTLNRASEAPYGKPNVKQIGDGLMVVWEVLDKSLMITRANAVVGLACALCSGYESWVKSTPELYKGVPESIGIGVDFGLAHRLTCENGAYDYLGLPANYAAKLQGLARPHGGVVIRDDWTLSNELVVQFTKRGKMPIGDDLIRVRATDGVRLISPPKNGATGKNGSTLA